MTTQDATVRYRVVGMDCADDAREIAEAARGVATVADVRGSVASQIMTLHLANAQDGASGVEQAVTALGYQLDRLDEVGDAALQRGHGTSDRLVPARRPSDRAQRPATRRPRRLCTRRHTIWPTTAGS